MIQNSTILFGDNLVTSAGKIFVPTFILSLKLTAGLASFRKFVFPFDAGTQLGLVHIAYYQTTAESIAVT
jgi:hypothetical protein